MGYSEIESRGQSSYSICLQAGLYNPSVIPALTTLAQGISIFAVFSRRSSLSPLNSFSMATVNLNHVQFWAPPSKPLLYKQRPALLHSTSKSFYTTSSRNQPVPLLDQAARISKRNDQLISAIAVAQHQGDDSTASAQGKIRENARNKPI
jgi:hypothetical protein